MVVGVQLIAADSQFCGMFHDAHRIAYFLNPANSCKKEEKPAVPDAFFDFTPVCVYTQAMIVVAAAVIENREGRILIARRKADITLGGYWEFPGGKLEEGESPYECAVRELLEEMDLHIEAGDVLVETTYDYGDRVVRLIAVKALMVGAISACMTTMTYAGLLCMRWAIICSLLPTRLLSSI